MKSRIYISHFFLLSGRKQKSYSFTVNIGDEIKITSCILKFLDFKNTWIIVVPSIKKSGKFRPVVYFSKEFLAVIKPLVLAEKDLFEKMLAEKLINNSNRTSYDKDLNILFPDEK